MKTLLIAFTILLTLPIAFAQKVDCQGSVYIGHESIERNFRAAGFEPAASEEEARYKLGAKMDGSSNKSAFELVINIESIMTLSLSEKNGQGEWELAIEKIYEDNSSYATFPPRNFHKITVDLANKTLNKFWKDACN